VNQYFSGKTLGRTKLTEISPKKTVEGAVGGLASSVVVAVALSKLTQWPSTPLAAAGLGVGHAQSIYCFRLQIHCVFWLS